MNLFDHGHWLMKGYLHFSYSFAMALVVLLAREFMPLALGHSTSPINLTSSDFLISLGVGTAIIALMLYLHLPKMINRCFNIGRQFGL
jgi:hypothetical protein